MYIIFFMVCIYTVCVSYCEKKLCSSRIHKPHHCKREKMFFSLSFASFFLCRPFIGISREHNTGMSSGAHISYFSYIYLLIFHTDISRFLLHFPIWFEAAATDGGIGATGAVYPRLHD